MFAVFFTQSSPNLVDFTFHFHQYFHQNEIKVQCHGAFITHFIFPQEKQVLISYSSTLSGSPTSSSVGNGLQQNSTPTVPPPKLQSVEKPTRPMASSSERKEERNQSDIMAQIAKIEEFMSTECLMPQKRLKTD